jgi:hypothetical protein
MLPVVLIAPLVILSVLAVALNVLPVAWVTGVGRAPTVVAPAPQAVLPWEVLVVVALAAQPALAVLGGWLRPVLAVVVAGAVLVALVVAILAVALVPVEAAVLAVVWELVKVIDLALAVAWELVRVTVLALAVVVGAVKVIGLALVTVLAPGRARALALVTLPDLILAVVSALVVGLGLGVTLI